MCTQMRSFSLPVIVGLSPLSLPVCWGVDLGLRHSWSATVTPAGKQLWRSSLPCPRLPSEYKSRGADSKYQMSTSVVLTLWNKVLLNTINAVYHLYELRSAERHMLFMNGICYTHRASLFHLTQKPPCCRIIHRNLAATAGLMPLVIDEQLRRQKRMRNK